MRILLTLDIWKPVCPEVAAAHGLLEHIADQIQIADCEVDIVAPPSRERTLAEWLEKASSEEIARQYCELPKGSLQDYDLIIGIDLPPGAQRLFCELGVPYLVMRPLPYDGGAGFALCRQNFRFPDEWSRPMPPLTKLIPPDAAILHSGALFAGTSLFNSDRIACGSLLNLANFQDKVIAMMAQYSRYYYVAPAGFDPSEIRFMKSMGCSFVNASLVTYLASPKIEAVFSVDSSIAVLTTTSSKVFHQLGTPQRWTPVPLRFFRNRDFLADMASSTEYRDNEKAETLMEAVQTV